MCKQIRLWKVGYLCKENPYNSMLPTREMLNQVKKILIEALNDAENDVLDLVWGPDLNVELIDVREEIENYILNGDGKLEKL